MYKVDLLDSDITYMYDVYSIEGLSNLFLL